MPAHDYRYDFPIPLPAGRDRVFAALTREADLRQWFAEHVEVDPRQGGAFRFWGRHTVGNPDESQADQRITRFEPGRTLAFRWTLLGCESTVTLKLRDGDPNQAEAETLILVEHHFDTLPEMGRATELVDDLWRIHTGSLLQFLMGSESVYRPDFSDDGAEVRVEIEIEAPPAAVFRTLVEPEYISQWFPAPKPVVDPVVGGRYGFGLSYELDGKKVEPPPCTIVEFEQDRRLAITWPDWRGDPSVPDQQVSWVLQDLGGRTRLILVHSGFTRAVDVSDYPFGWQHFLQEISRVSASPGGEK